MGFGARAFAALQVADLTGDLCGATQMRRGVGRSGRIRRPHELDLVVEIELVQVQVRPPFM